MKVKDLAENVKKAVKNTQVELQTISEKGLAIWPNIIFEELQSEIPRLRFMSKEKSLDINQIIKLQEILVEKNMMPAAVIPLKTYDDMAGFTKAQGE